MISFILTAIYAEKERERQRETDRKRERGRENTCAEHALFHHHALRVHICDTTRNAALYNDLIQ